MMFQGKIKELCQDIHNLLGNKKIIEYFLKDVEFKKGIFFKNESNFINQDYSALPWNRWNHFASINAPKKINYDPLKAI